MWGDKVKIDQKLFRQLIIQAIERVLEEERIKKLNISKKKLYVILSENWNSNYWNFFDELNKEKKYEVYVVLSSKILNNLHLNNLKKFEIIKGVFNEDNINFDELKEGTIIFPTTPREVIVKTALCIDDILETKLIFKSIENGQRVVLLKSGLKKFSGKEPKAYINKILSYYKTVLEFNIEIYENIDSGHYIKDEYMKKEYSNSYYSKAVFENSKKIITENEIEKYVQNNKIILNNKDIITEMARDKARSLNISIIRK